VGVSVEQELPANEMIKRETEKQNKNPSKSAFKREKEKNSLLASPKKWRIPLSVRRNVSRVRLEFRWRQTDQLYRNIQQDL
jgi:predicted YcjX-like family ATPase